MKLGIYLNLKLLRIHTACLTMAGTMLGAIVGGERSPIILLVFAVWALCFHAWGFLQNNLYDLKYDMKDPSKQHFPLVDGTIKVTRAWAIHYVFLGLVLVIGFVMSMLRMNAVPILFLLTAITFGTMYNMFSKRTLSAPLFITISFTSLPLFSFLMVSDTLNTAILLVATYTIFLMMYQIAWSGYYKDIGSDKVNLLRVIGCKLTDGVFQSSPSGIFFAVILKSIGLGVTFLIWFVADSDLLSLVLLIVIMFLALYFVMKQINIGKFEKNTVLRLCSLVEIFSYFVLVFGLQGVLSWLGVLLFLVFPIIWFVTLNFATWGSFIAPKV